VSERKRRQPQRIGDAIASFLDKSGLAGRVDQAGVIPEWPELVGAQIAAVTEPQAVSPDGTLFVAVRTNAWMTELSLLEPQLLVALNRKPDRAPVTKIHWRLMR
jgi:predicted nucleic acid-binding Zn ribbon protein